MSWREFLVLVPHDCRAAIAIALLTGRRKGELAGLSFGELALQIYARGKP